jgi:CBS domain containing-hemolysin-like protein
MTFQLILLACLLLGSAFFSGAETALFSLTRHELTRLAKDHRASARLVADLLQNPRRLLLTLMIGNVTINTFIFAMSLSLFESLAGSAGQQTALAALLGLISPIVVTMCGEILPKGTAILLRNQVSPKLAPPVRLVQAIFTPFRAVLNALLVEPLTRLLTADALIDDYVTVEELRELIQMSQRHRVIDADENAMLGQVLELSERCVRDVMVPRVDVVAFDIQSPPEEARMLMREKRFTKLPVYDGEKDRIIGLLYAKDLLLERDRPLITLIRPIHFVPELITLTQLLNEFRRTQTQLAAVVDEHGGMVGVVAVEDVAEEIVGDLALAHEPAEPAPWERIDDRTYRVSGQMNIRDWAEQFHGRQLNEGVTTVGGLILSRLGRQARVQDHVMVGNLELRVESMSGRRIDQVRIELMDRQARDQRHQKSGQGGQQ